MANNTLLANDSFISGSLAAGWQAYPGVSECNIVVGSPNVAEPGSTTGNYAQLWSGITVPNDQISELTINALTAESGTSIKLFVRASLSGNPGYLAVITDNTLLVYVIESNGTANQLSTTITGLTVAAGDVWTFQAAGSCLSVHQNNSRVYYYYDTTWTSGAPGFGQASTVNVTHTQVSGWRGYSCIKQDGVWKKQGVVLAPNSTDLAIAPNGQGIQAPTIIYDTNPQILAGPNVYKMWFVNNWAASTNVGGLFYAESADGINWTRNSASTPILTGYTNTVVYKNGSTYYLYCQIYNQNGTGTFQVFTSNNGTSWAIQSPSQTIGLGSGTWDDASIYPAGVIAVVSGTWYGSYLGSATATPTAYSTGLITSTDGINWVKYAGNPTLVGRLPQCFTQVGSIYYGWFQANQPGQDATALDPIEVVRYQTTNFESWTNPQHSVHHSQIFESLNANTGYCITSSILNVGGIAYLWLQSGQNDPTAPQIGQISLAIAPTSISNLVQYPENALSQIALDSFTSGTGNLSGNWTTPSFSGAQPCQIVSGNLAEGTVLGSLNEALYTGSTFGVNQYAQITIAAISNSSSDAFLVLRGSLVAKTQYLCTIPEVGVGTATISFTRQVNGTSTAIGPLYTLTVSVNDIFRASVTTGPSGQAILTVFQNEFQLLEVEDWSPISSGYPGFALVPGTSLSAAQISNFTAGTPNVIPNYPSGGTFVNWSPLDSRQAVPGFGPGPNTGIADTQGNEIFSAQDPPNPPFAGNSQVSDNASIPPQDCRVTKPTDCRVNIPVNSRASQV